MVSSVNPYPPLNTLSSFGNASMDYLNLALVVQVNDKLKESTREFISSFNPQSFICTYA